MGGEATSKQSLLHMPTATKKPYGCVASQTLYSTATVPALSPTLGPLSYHPFLRCRVISIPCGEGGHLGAMDFLGVYCTLGPCDCTTNHDNLATTSVNWSADCKIKGWEFWLGAGGKGIIRPHILVHWHPMNCHSGRQNIFQEGVTQVSKMQQTAAKWTCSPHHFSKSSTFGYAKWHKQVWSLWLPQLQCRWWVN